MQIERLRGRNGFDPPLLIPDDQAVEMLNMDLYDGQLGRKRPGSSNDTMTFSSGGPFTGSIRTLIRHVPGQDESAMELFAIELTATPVVGRKAASTQYVAVTVKDNISGGIAAIHGVSFNGKLFFGGWDSAVNRAQVWDGSTIRRVGVGTPAAPTGADDGAGTLTLSRSYKIAYTVQVSSVTVRRSELGPVLTRSITNKLGSTITKPAAISEGETHWELYAADTPTGTYYLIATTVVGTTTFDDTAATIPTTTAAPIAGTNSVPGSAKFVATDGNRVLWYGSLETSAGDAVEPKNGRVWFSAVLGASATSIGDDERIPIQATAGGLRYYIDVGENDGGEPRGLAGPLYGSMYAFQSHGITELAPTNRANTPYRRFQMSRTHGAVNHRSIIEGPDAAGNPCLYFLSPKDGPRRISRAGLEWVGADVKDVWDTINLDASTTVGHGIYYPDRNQILWWVSTGSNGVPDTIIMFDITEGISSVANEQPAIRKGWTKWMGNFAKATCSCLFSTTPGASMARKLVPYIGRHDVNNVVMKLSESVTDDAGTTFQAYVDTKIYAPGGLSKHFAITGGSVAAEPASGVTFSVTAFQEGTKDSTNAASAVTDAVSLTPVGSESLVVRRLEAFQLAELRAMKLRMGDSSAVANTWTLDAVTITVQQAESFTG
jgi:hypothetical protein